MYHFLRENKIMVNLHYIPIYRQPYFKKLGFEKGYCFEAEEYFKEAISLPIYSTLKEDDQDFVIEKIKECLKNK